MRRHSRGIRRWFGLVGALWILALPVSQYAHAAAMMQDGCSGAAMMSGPMAQASLHAAAPGHDANCCDLCFACCTVTALAAGAPDIAFAAAVTASASATPPATPLALRVDHLLPFPQAPPLLPA